MCGIKQAETTVAMFLSGNPSISSARFEQAKEVLKANGHGMSDVYSRPIARQVNVAKFTQDDEDLGDQRQQIAALPHEANPDDDGDDDDDGLIIDIYPAMVINGTAA